MVSNPRSYSDDWKVPTSIGIWGGSRATRTRTASAVARRIDPGFYWLQAVGEAGSHDAADRSLSERVPSGHLFYVRPPELPPQTRLENVADWFGREDVDAGTRLQRIGEFLGLPSLARNVTEGRSGTSPARALVLADANLAEPFFSLEEGGIRPFIEACNQYATSLVITLSNRPNPNSRDIDYMLQIRSASPEEESGGSVECRQGPPSGTAGLFAVGRALALNALVEELRQVRPGGPRD
jgi:hypothetical protein